MGKLGRRTGGRERVEGQLRLPLRGLASADLWKTVVISGLALVEEELEEERARVCGPRYAHQPERRRCGVGTPKARWCWAGDG
jgi:hypothetical protein